MALSRNTTSRNTSRNISISMDIKTKNNMGYEQDYVPFNPREYIKPGISVRDVMMYKEIFDIMDLDGKNYLTPMDLRNAMLEMGYRPKKQLVYQFISDQDVDESGCIDFDEFIKCMTNKPYETDTDEDIMRIFNNYDVDKKGYITLEDLKEIAVELREDISDEDLKSIIEQLDPVNKDKITPKTWMQFMRKKTF